MGAYSEEIKNKTDEELIKLIYSADEFSATYNKDLRKELKKRGIRIEDLGLPILSLDARRKICESCQNHLNEIPTNPDSNAICGLTMKNPSFLGSLCENYVPIPAFKKRLLMKAFIALILGVIVIAEGVFMYQDHLAEGYIYTRDVVLMCSGPVLIVYAFVYFIKMVRFKYPPK